MQRSMRRLAFGLMLWALIFPFAAAAYEAPYRAGFPVKLNNGRIEFGSVTLANLSGDSTPEIVVGGSDGVVHVVQGNGQVVWSYNVSAAIKNLAVQRGLRNTTTLAAIRSAPAVADVTGDGRPEVVVTVGDITEVPSHGGVIVLDAQGRVLPGWPQLALDFSGATGPDGYADGIVSSPAVGDIDGDGRPEIVYGAFDQYVHARRADGSLVPNWPQFVLDTVWSSPALADLDGNGRLDVIIGVDAHYYRGQPRYSEDGGDLYAFRGDGSIMWRAHQDEIFESSPAVADLDNDGRFEIVAGTGTYYSNLGRADGRYISAWNHDGSLAWRTTLPERVPGSPALGDVNGDGALDVVVGAFDGKVYALRGTNGTILWSTAVRDIFNNKYLPDPNLQSPALGDYDGDRINDVFITIGWEVAVLKGTNGTQLTANGTNNSTMPSYYTKYSISGTPAVGDLDNDGKLDLVAGGGDGNDQFGRVYTWRLPNSTTTAGWPMLRGSPQHTATLGTARQIDLAPQVYIPMTRR